MDQTLNVLSMNLQEASANVEQVLSSGTDAFAVLQNTGRVVVGMSPAMEEIRSQINLQSSNMATTEMVDRISTQGTAILANAQETNQTVASMSFGVALANS